MRDPTMAVPLMMTDLERPPRWRRRHSSSRPRSGDDREDRDLGDRGAAGDHPGDDWTALIAPIRAARRRHPCGHQQGDLQVGGPRGRRARGRTTWRAESCGWWRDAATRRSSRPSHGFVLAAAGIDASNVPAGTVALLPLDPDQSARGSGHPPGDLGIEVARDRQRHDGPALARRRVDTAIGAAGSTCCGTCAVSATPPAICSRPRSLQSPTSWRQRPSSSRASSPRHRSLWSAVFPSARRF